ncbi:hypothetical protein [Lentibacillus amyloliquefaciens]|uniref:HIRAN domain-containing protein n=1 Tax=Lentibacillus amyloliquefaciens TaxID=1472767 RepID=A0A0U4FHX9_9BACI|nr:hypothetical protein [Lentibacillus amyloliquefaciens]ALX50141.1 hypothetical protein AOX59_17085 [Lentibacillus amyloliquefaciens]
MNLNVSGSKEKRWYISKADGKLALFKLPISFTSETQATLREPTGETWSEKNDLVDNPKEEKAVELIDPQNNDMRAGYISKPYNDLFFQLVSKGYSMTASVISVDENSGRPTIEIRAKVNLEDVKACGCDYIINYD